jgi:hypothetical protein
MKSQTVLIAIEGFGGADFPVVICDLLLRSNTAATIKANNTSPPTTPPAIAPEDPDELFAPAALKVAV